MTYKNPNLKIIIPKQKYADSNKLSKKAMIIDKDCQPFFDSFALNDINFDKFVVYVIGKSYNLKLNLHNQKKYIIEYINYIINLENLNSKYINYKLKNNILEELVLDILILNKNRQKSSIRCYCC
jgi:hypothetical protein